MNKLTTSPNRSNQLTNHHRLTLILVSCFSIAGLLISLGWFVSQYQLTWPLLLIICLMSFSLMLNFISLVINRPQPCPDNSPARFLDSVSLLNSLSDGIIVIDQQGLIKFLNQQAIALVGFQPEEALGINYNSVLRLTTNDDQPFTTSTNLITLINQQQTALQFDLLKLQTYSNKIIPINLRVTPICDGSQQLLLAFHDISRELNKEREQLEFISTASHEMRTPIATINGYLGLALNPKTAQIDDKAREYILKAQAAVAHLGELFKNLLSISKAEDKRIAIRPVVIDLIPFVEQICDNFRPQLTNHPSLSLNFTPSLGQTRTVNPTILIYTDPSLLQEVISNLIENAIKYTARGTVTVNVATQGTDLAQISIADTGIGIPPEDIPHLFQKFYRVDNSQTREIGGTGLGLYLCRKIIENLHGRIWATSTLGKGSTFFIELQRIDQARANQLQLLEKTVIAEPGQS